jgi:hypothetical protein
LQGMISQIQDALPNFLALTNQLTRILDNSAQVTSNLNVTVIETHPLLTNVNLTIEHLDTNVNRSLVQMQPLLANANSLVAHMDTNVTAALENLAGITSNLNAQVQSNSNMLSNISKTVVDSDDFVQGLKHHWLLRSAFKKENKTNAVPAKTTSPKKP